MEEFGEFLTEKSESDDEDKVSKKSSQSSSSSSAKRSKKGEPVLTQTKDYVAATLSAWNNCPGIVKK